MLAYQLHSCDLDDGYEWGRLNLHSVTEQSRLDEFLSTAELAGIEFKAQKLNVKVVESGTYTGLPTPQERARTRQAEEENRQYLSIPRRYAHVTMHATECHMDIHVGHNGTVVRVLKS